VPAHLVDGHDVRMLEARDGLGLAQEPLGERGGRFEIEIEDLHCDVTVERRIAHAKHGREAALPKERPDRKFLTQGLLQALLESCEIHGGRES